MTSMSRCSLLAYNGCVYGLAELPAAASGPLRAAIVLDASDSMPQATEWLQTMRVALAATLPELPSSASIDCYLLGQAQPFGRYAFDQLISSTDTILAAGERAAQPWRRHGSFLRPTLDAISQVRNQGDVAVYVLSDGWFYDDLIDATPASYPSLQLTAVDLAISQQHGGRERFLPRIFTFARIVSHSELGEPQRLARIRLRLVWQGLEMLHVEVRPANPAVSSVIPLTAVAPIVADFDARQWTGAHLLSFRALPLASHWSVNGALSTVGKLEFAHGGRDVASRVAALEVVPGALLRGLWRAIGPGAPSVDPARVDTLLDALLKSDDADLAAAARSLNRVWLRQTRDAAGSAPYLVARRFFPDLPGSTLTLRSANAKQPAETVLAVQSLGPESGRIESIEKWLVVSPTRFEKGQTQVRVRATRPPNEHASSLRAPLLLSLGEEQIVLDVRAEFA